VTKRRHTTAGLFVLLAGIWGMSFVAARAALGDVSPVLLAALRFDVAGVLVFGYAVATTDRWLPATREDWYGVAVGGLLFVAAHHALLFAGQQYVTSAVAAVVISLDPVLATAFAALLLPDERLSWVGIVGLLLGLGGVAIIAGLSPGALLGADVAGVGLVFLSAAAFALGAVLIRRLRTDLPARSMQAWMMLVGAPLLHLTALALPGEQLKAITWSPSALAGLSYLAVVAAGLGYFLYFELLDRLGPVEINLVAYLVPAVAAAGGWLLLGEALRIRTLLGFLGIAGGFVAIKREALSGELDRLRAR
jgi:drug/metabolite transporter (DMT)-like permease